MPPKRRVLVLVNPFSGQRLAARVWAISEQILMRAYITYKVIETERAMHAYELVSTMAPD